MRVPIALLLLILGLLLLSCHSETAKKNAANQQQGTKTAERKAQPEDLGDSTEPIEIRALKGAKDVKKEMDKRREEEKQILQQRDQ